MNIRRHEPIAYRKSSKSLQTSLISTSPQMNDVVVDEWLLNIDRKVAA